MSINNIVELNNYLSSHNIDESFDMINNHFTISESFMIDNYRSRQFFEILVKYDYDLILMKTKIFQYLDHIERQKDKTLNKLLFIPFQMRYLSKGDPIYEQEKHYDNGYRRYRSYICGYEYRSVPTSFVDKIKISKIRKLFSIFFDTKLFFQNKLNRDCINHIFSYLDDYESIFSKIVWKLDKITYKDRQPRFESCFS
jgi:hypothetical protein